MPDFSTFQVRRDYTRENAYWLGRASLLAYQSQAVAQAEVATWGLTDFTYFDQQETQAFLAGNAELMILAFRGTTDLRDWIADADVDLVGGPGGRVHEGFSVALSFVWRDLWTAIRDLRQGRALFVTGHSLGAALATLAVAKLRLERDEPVHALYNFGQPRAGDRTFATRFDADFGAQSFRYVNNADIVPRVPFRSMQYSHIGTLKYFDREGVQQDTADWWDIIRTRIQGRIVDLLRARIDDIEDHRMDLYLHNLERALP